MTHQIIYVPGLGDNKSAMGQRLAVATWRLWGVKPHVFQMKWGDGRPFQTKLDSLMILIDRLLQQGNVSLVGSSAGATAVINAFAARPHSLTAVVCIAGKINNPQKIAPHLLQSHPDFGDSAYRTTQSLAKLGPKERKRILSRFAAVDKVVPMPDSVVDGAVNRRMLSVGHAFTIGTQLLFGAPLFIRFIKQQKQQ